MPRHQTFALVAAAALCASSAVLPAQTAERKLELSFNNGLVRLVATNVTVREILGEWTRRGGSQIINGEKMGGAPITVVFENASEREVLDSLLRSAAGYVLAPRLPNTTAGSQFAVISILPTSQAVAGPTFGGSPAPAPVRTGPDDEIPPVTPPAVAGQPVNPPANTQPQPDPNANRPAGTSGAAPGVVPIVPVVPVGPAAPTPPPNTGRGGPPPAGAGS
jgi:hypothetical protein